MKRKSETKVERARRSSAAAPRTTPVAAALAFPIVGIGASAGGLEALEQFLRHVPRGSGTAYVIVQHLDPTRQGIMPELLQRATEMPVSQVKDRTRVQPNRVYVIPPNKDLSLLNGVTNFFRDPGVWDHLRRHALPDLLANRPPGHALRAWVAGCSTGEEAFSLAMVFREAVGETNSQGGITLQIFATDLDRDAIDKARHGVFPANIAADVSSERLARFFTQEERGYRVRKEIREMVIFAPQNLIKLIAGDIGRPITDLASQLEYPELAEDGRRVLQSLVPAEKLVACLDGRWFTVRIMPYRTTDDRIDGLVITFADVTAARAAAAKLGGEQASLEKRFARQTSSMQQARRSSRKLAAARPARPNPAGGSPAAAKTKAGSG